MLQSQRTQYGGGYYRWIQNVFILFVTLFMYVCMSTSSAENVRVYSVSNQEIDYAYFVDLHDVYAFQVSASHPCFSATSDGLLLDKTETELLLVPACYCDDSLELPEGIERNSSIAFAACSNLTSLKLPSTFIEYIPSNYSWLREILVSETNPYMTSVDGVLFSKNKEVLIAYPIGRDGSEYVIPNGVTTIGEFSFASPELVTVNLSETVEVIEKYAFSDCENLQSVLWNSTIRSIGKGAFLNTGVRILILPNGIRYIADRAFEQCPLEFVYLPSSIEYIGEDAFRSSTDIHVTFYCEDGTYAENWLKQQGIVDYVILD